MQAREEETVSDIEKKLVEEVRYIKDAMSHVFTEKALTRKEEPALEQGSKEGVFYYLVGSVLGELDVKYLPDPKLILATDGNNLYVGPAYHALKKKLEQKNPKKWRRLRYALLLHEVIHVLYGHPHRIKLIDDPELYNIVADLLVNTVVERKLKVKIPPEFVTVDSFPQFLRVKLGIELTPEKKEAIKKIADLFLKGEITVEDAYKIFESLEPQVLAKIRQHFRKGFFFGHDLADKTGKRFALPKTGEGSGQDRRLGGTDKEERTESTGGEKTSEKGSREKEGKEGKTSVNGGDVENREAEGQSETEKHEEREAGKEGMKGEKDREGEGKKAGRGKKEGKEATDEPGEEEGAVEVSPGKLAEKGRDIERTASEIRRELGKLLQEIRRAMGEYKAIKNVLEKNERHAGKTSDVMGEAEYRKMRVLTIPLEVQFLREVGESVSEPKVTYIRHDEDAYWLPAEEEEERPRVLVLLDSSPSISDKELMLFMNLVRKAMEIYDIEYEISTFSVGEVDHKILHLDNFDEARFKLKRGLGTVWNRTIAERIRKAAQEGIRLIQVLSDFYILVHPEVLEEIKRFKSLGGRVSCYSVTGKYLNICDYKHDIRLS